jgi:hypothetical protein
MVGAPWARNAKKVFFPVWMTLPRLHGIISADAPVTAWARHANISAMLSLCNDEEHRNCLERGCSEPYRGCGKHLIEI